MLSISKNPGFLSRCVEFLNRQVGSILLSPSVSENKSETARVLAVGVSTRDVLPPPTTCEPASARRGEHGVRPSQTNGFAIAVCGEEEVPRYYQSGITDILTCVSPQRPVFRPSWPSVRNHLIVRCDDVEEPLEQYTFPTVDHVRQMVRFGQEALQRSKRGEAVRLLVHCAAGISRSTAATLLILSMKYGKGAEQTALRHLVKLRPQCRPNTAIVAHGDHLLELQGRLIREVTLWRATSRSNEYAA